MNYRTVLYRIQFEMTSMLLSSLTDSTKSIGQLIVHNLPHIELQLFQLKQIFQDTYS